MCRTIYTRPICSDLFTKYTDFSIPFYPFYVSVLIWLGAWSLYLTPYICPHKLSTFYVKELLLFIHSFIHSYNTFYFIWSFSFPVLVIVHNAFHSYISQWNSHQSIFNFFLWAWTNEHYKMCIWIFFSALAFTLYSRWRYFEFLRLILISCICAMKRSIVMFGEVY